MAPASASPGLAGRPRLRGLGAAAVAVVFLCVAAAAPLTVAGAIVDQDRAERFSAADDEQTLSTPEADGQVVDTTVTAGALSKALENTEGGAKSSKALYTLAQFMFTGAVNWNGYKFTFYSQSVLPGSGLAIPGRHVNDDGYVADEDDYIVLAGDAEKGTVFPTPFGYEGKIYDRGTVGNHLDVYIK